MRLPGGLATSYASRKGIGLPSQLSAAAERTLGFNYTHLCKGILYGEICEVRNIHDMPSRHHRF